MKPLLSESDNNQSLQALGRASVQIVHDLKNQLNGLKLYATFLRKRLEKSERPGDELETINKLIGGLDRTAADLSLLVDYGRPLTIRIQPRVDLKKLVSEMAESINQRPSGSGPLLPKIAVKSSPTSLIGNFDPARLSDALGLISISVLRMVSKSRQEPFEISVNDDESGPRRDGVIEWQGITNLDHDPFRAFVGSDEIRMSLAAKIIEEHGGSAERDGNTLRVVLPLAD